jgi:hypothetical protein
MAKLVQRNIQVVIRGLALMVPLVVVVAFSARLIYVFQTYHERLPLGSLIRLLSRIDTWQLEIRWGIPALLIAAALWVFQRRLSRLIVPQFGNACPECGYDLRGTKGNRCPECGTEPKHEDK